MTATRNRRVAYTVWIDAAPKVDYLVALGAGIVVLGSSWFLPGALDRAVYPALTDGARWATIVATFSAVAATLAGFGATAISVVLVLSAGSRGRKVIVRGGRDLRLRLMASLGAIAGIAVLLASATTLTPTAGPRYWGTGLAVVVTFFILRLVRLGVLFSGLLQVYVLDNEESAPDGE